MRSVFVLATVLVVAGLVSCGLHRSKIRAAAAPDMSCPAGSIEVSKIYRTDADKLGFQVSGAPKQFYAQGCGKHDVYVEVCDAQQCYFSSAGKMRLGKLNARAAFDTDGCGELATTWLDYNTAGLTGCDQRLTYVWRCPHDPRFYSERCSWVLNADSRSTPATGPAQGASPADPSGSQDAPVAPNPAGGTPGLDKM